MYIDFKKMDDEKEIKVSVPCRIDLGGTIDISTFFIYFNYLNPSTVNIALDMRTKVKLSTWRNRYIKISSKGFESAEFELDKFPSKHPMSLMFAIARFFKASGVHIEIESSSPPRSALGGSSAAAAALIAAFKIAVGENIEPAQIAMLAHYIESSVAGVPCGLQDQLAAAYGGVNCWYWKIDGSGISFLQENLIQADRAISDNIEFNNDYISDDLDLYGNKEPFDINDNILVAYCGIPHVSSDINSRWVKSFLAGKNKDKWKEIIKITHAFSDSIKRQYFDMAGCLMNMETKIRLRMTPNVLDKTGKALFECAKQNGCGARFTGAGGGGCIWAIGEKDDIAKLKNGWKDILDREPEAKLLDTKVDFRGIEEFI